MYSNIGKKIMALASVIAVFSMIASFLYGIFLIANDLEVHGALTMVLGPLAAWIGGFFLYGFGRLIDNSDYVARKMGRKDGFGIPDVTDELDWSASDDDVVEEAPVANNIIAQRIVENKLSAPSSENIGSDVAFCSSCGTKLNENQRFCQHCGFRVR